MLLFLEWHCLSTSLFLFPGTTCLVTSSPPPSAVLQIAPVPHCGALRLVFAAAPFSIVNIGVCSTTHSPCPKEPRPLFHCGPDDPNDDSTALCFVPAPEQGCRAAGAWWSEDIVLKGVSHIRAALARHGLERPFLQWLRPDGSAL